MNLEITPEVLASQLEIGKTDAILKQITTNHIISLSDKLKHMNAYIGLSNQEPCFKIKCEETETDAIKKEFLDEVSHWSEKYNVELKQVDNKNVFYILGKK